MFAVRAGSLLHRPGSHALNSNSFQSPENPRTCRFDEARTADAVLTKESPSFLPYAWFRGRTNCTSIVRSALRLSALLRVRYALIPQAYAMFHEPTNSFGPTRIEN